MATIRIYNKHYNFLLKNNNYSAYNKGNSVYDLAIIDPPYGIGEDGSKNHTRSKLATSKNYKGYSGNDKKAPSKAYFKQLKNISKNQIIFGANYFIENISKANSSSWIVWDKDNGETDFADCELAYTSFNRAVRKFKWKWSGMLQQNMKNKQKRIHPNEKPIDFKTLSILVGSNYIAGDLFGEIDGHGWSADEAKEKFTHLKIMNGSGVVIYTQ
jgi:hypothetical protein